MTRDGETSAKLLELRQRIEALELLLKVAKCPHCNGNGVIQISDDECEQCRWCFERDAINEPNT